MPKQIKERVEVGRDDAGKPVYQWATGYTRQQVLQSAARLINKSNVVRETAQAQQELPLFETYAKDWIRIYKTSNIRHTTLGEYNSLLNKHLIPVFGKKRMNEITTDSIQMFMNERKEYAAKSIREMRMVLTMILEGAVEDGYIARNPSKSKRLIVPSKKKNPRIALTEKQAQDIIVHIPDLEQSRDQRYIALLMYTGMRREEVLGLKWSDIDWEKMIIHVHNTITFKGNASVEGPTKTEAGMRYIPINPSLISWLKHTGDNVEYVVQDSITQQIVKRMWHRIKAQINVYGATPHCFRHTFATVCHRKGMSDKTLQAIGGWADVATMRDIYTHTQEQDIRNAAHVMADMYREKCDKQCDKQIAEKTIVQQGISSS